MKDKEKTSVTDILFGIGILVMMFMISLGLILQAKNDNKRVEIFEKEAKQLQYERWKDCIDKADGSDASCIRCDEIYGEHTYLTDSLKSK